MKSLSDNRLSVIEQKMQEHDQFICYRIEQEQRQSAHGMVVTLVLLPLNITLWIAKRMTGLLPVPHALLGSTASAASASANPVLHHHHRAKMSLPTKHLTHPDIRPTSTNIMHGSTAPDPTKEEATMALNQQRSLQR